MHKRILLIARNDYWPGITPFNVWELEASLWPQLAIACDQIAAKREEQRAELESKIRG